MSFTQVASDKHIASVSTQANVRAAGEDDVTIAYDRREFPVLVREMRHERLPRRLNALRVFRDELGPARSFALAASAGACPALLSVLKDESVAARQGAIGALSALARNGNGRAHLLETPGFAGALSAAMQDKDGKVRLVAHEAALDSAEEADGVDLFVQHGFVAQLARRVRDAPVDEQAVSMHLLLRLQQENVGGAGATEALASGTVEAAVALTGSPSKAVRWSAAANLAACAMTEEGKQAAEAAGAVGALCGLLSDSSARVAAEACHALANVSVLDSVKNAAVERGALPLLVELLEHRSQDVQLHAMKALSNLVAAPAGRAYLRESEAPERVRRIARGHEPLLVESATVLAELIERSP